MQHLDVKVIEQALGWLGRGDPVWLCTVLSTYGSSPREPGSMLVANANGQHVGSLSGGCVEEDFLERVKAGAFRQAVERVRYGAEQGLDSPRVTLPCGGMLEVLVERLEPTASARHHIEALLATLLGQQSQVRRVHLLTGESVLLAQQEMGARVTHREEDNTVAIRVGPAARLIIAGISSVSVACAEFAKSLGYEVVVCDPREEEQESFLIDGVRLEPVLPSMFIASPGACHSSTAVVALTHDPRIDDLAMIEAVRTPAFYIGVMGSHKTSRARAERLRRSGGLSEAEIERIQMPIGLALGSKTPTEIALAVMADVLRVQRGQMRDAL